MNERIEQIRERLEAATPGPWVKDPSTGGPDCGFIYSPDGDPVCQVFSNGYCVERQEEYGEFDVELIAHAPSDIAYLLSELDRTNKQLHMALSPIPVPQVPTGQGWRVLTTDERAKIKHDAETLPLSDTYEMPINPFIVLGSLAYVDWLESQLGITPPPPTPICPHSRAGLEQEGGEGRCTVPPAGWVCSRKPGHDGPCAASPVKGGQGR